MATVLTADDGSMGSMHDASPVAAMLAAGGENLLCTMPCHGNTAKTLEMFTRVTHCFHLCNPICANLIVLSKKPTTLTNGII
jgi:hypothetical protein